MEFALKFKQLLKTRRYSQDGFARDLSERLAGIGRNDVSQNLVSLWTRGLAIPDMREAEFAAELLGVDLNFLADDSLNEPALGPAELAAVEIIQANSLGKAEVIRRLTTETWASVPSLSEPPKSGFYRRGKKVESPTPPLPNPTTDKKHPRKSGS
jgi:transcriptional regulator with XRE-family HTH domain